MAQPLRLIELNPDHPGFRDLAYRRRRDEIAMAARTHRVPSPAPRIHYIDEERAVWRSVLAELEPLHARLACEMHLAAWPRIGFHGDEVHQLVDVSQTLTAATGFSLQPVAGLVTPRVFMEHLADGVFLATQYMRHHSRPFYTPEPDVIHELCGHAALLTDPRYAEVNRAFGEATRRADDARVEALIRVYWFGLEFGLVREGGTPKAIGAGLLSSIGELRRVENNEVELRPFDIDAIARTPFDTMQYQGTLFVAESTTRLLDELAAWLSR